ncbi:MAG: LysR family transcriptional regulator [Methanomassiliicoccales archaeon]|nr:MAG: LysR family transcriptional regulator [Methanomassiliicoccales archaeon]
MKLEPAVALVVNDRSLTTHQLEVIEAIYETGSQKAAAKRLGISTPVLHRYLHQVEAKVGMELVRAGPKGTVLNSTGEEIAKEFIALKAKLRQTGKVVVGCTVITEELVLSALSSVIGPEDYDLIISTDERNMRDFKARMMDLVVLDDPLYAYDMDDILWEEVAEDRMLHVERGLAYGVYQFGAQRIGFRYLDTKGVQYRLERKEHSLSSLIRSNMSFFVNESLAMRKGLDLKSSTDPDLLKHKILAVYWSESPKINMLLREMSKRTLRN